MLSDVRTIHVFGKGHASYIKQQYPPEEDLQNKHTVLGAVQRIRFTFEFHSSLTKIELTDEDGEIYGKWYI